MTVVALTATYQPTEGRSIVIDAPVPGILVAGIGSRAVKPVVELAFFVFDWLPQSRLVFRREDW